MVVSSPAWTFDVAPPPTLYEKVNVVFVGVSPKFKLLLIVELIAPGISDKAVPFTVTPACSTGSTFVALSPDLNNPLPKQTLYVCVSSSNFDINFLFVLMY